MQTRQRQLKKQQEVLGGYDPAQYRSERVYAQAPERVKLAWQRILEDAGGKLPVYPFRDTDKVKGPMI